MSTQKENTTPLEGRPGEGDLLPLSRGPLGTSSVGNGGKNFRVPSQLGKQTICIPTYPQGPISSFPSPGTWSQKGSVGLPRLPLLGERVQSGGPVSPRHTSSSHITARLVPTDQDKEHMWAEAAARC